MKVLIISHNPITTYQSMGKTMLSLFSSFDKNELCQLYIYPTVPDTHACNSYFRVTDRDILRSFIRFGRVKPRIIGENDIDTKQHSIYENEKEADFYKKNKKSSLTLLCRDIMWALSCWYNRELKEWLEKEKPTCIFLAPGESKFIYNIALKIAKKLNIEIFTYVCDDYYFVNSPKGVKDKFQLYLLRKKMKQTMMKSKRIITICDELGNAYKKEFGTETRTIFTGSNFPVSEKPSEYDEVKGITYMGNLSCNRFVSVAEIGRALDNINRENKTDYSLFLYTPRLSDEIKRAFSDIRSIEHCGYVTGKEFDNILHTSPVLLHVEAFDRESVDRVKHSVSTKIADSLGSGNLLLAFGPDKVASIKHLIRNDCAVVATDPNKLQETLKAVFDNDSRNDTIKKALEVAKQCHSSCENSVILRSLLSDS